MIIHAISASLIHDVQNTSHNNTETRICLDTTRATDIAKCALTDYQITQFTAERQCSRTSVSHVWFTQRPLLRLIGTNKCISFCVAAAMAKTISRRPARGGLTCGRRLAKLRTAACKAGVSPFIYVGKKQVAIKQKNLDELVSKLDQMCSPSSLHT